MSTAKTKSTNTKEVIDAAFLTNQLVSDTKSAVLLASFAINMFILTTWLVLESTNRFDAAVISYIAR